MWLASSFAGNLLSNLKLDFLNVSVGCDLKSINCYKPASQKFYNPCANGLFWSWSNISLLELCIANSYMGECSIF